MVGVNCSHGGTHDFLENLVIGLEVIVGYNNVRMIVWYMDMSSFQEGVPYCFDVLDYGFNAFPLCDIVVHRIHICSH